MNNSLVKITNNQYLSKQAGIMDTLSNVAIKMGLKKKSTKQHIVGYLKGVSDALSNVKDHMMSNPHLYGAAALVAAAPAIGSALAGSGLQNAEETRRNPGKSGLDLMIQQMPHIATNVASPVPFLNDIVKNQAASSLYHEVKQGNPGMLGMPRFSARNPFLSGGLGFVPFVGGVNRAVAGMSLGNEDVRNKGFAYNNPYVTALGRQFVYGPTAAHTAMAVTNRHRDDR